MPSWVGTPPSAPVRWRAVLPRTAHTLSWLEQCEGSKGSRRPGQRLNPEPATNGGRPLSASQNEGKQAKKGLLGHLFSPMDPCNSQPVRLGMACSPPGRGGCPAGSAGAWTWENCLSEAATGLRREGSRVLLSGAGGPPPNLLQGPQTSLTNQAAVPFAPSAQGPLTSLHCHPALSPVPSTNHTSSQSHPPNLPLR